MSFRCLLRQQLEMLLVSLAFLRRLFRFSLLDRIQLLLLGGSWHGDQVRREVWASPRSEESFFGLFSMTTFASHVAFCGTLGGSAGPGWSYGQCSGIAYRLSRGVLARALERDRLVAPGANAGIGSSRSVGRRGLGHSISNEYEHLLYLAQTLAVLSDLALVERERPSWAHATV